MKGIICYFSTTGNTLLACKYIAQGVKNIKFDLCDITKVNALDLTNYKVIGFATFVQSLGPPFLIKDFIERLPEQKQKYAFVVNTYANYWGRTLRVMTKLLKKKGFTIISSFALHAPENYPPYIVKGIIHRDAPNNEELKMFKSFVANLDKCFNHLIIGENIIKRKIQFSFINNIMPVLSRKRSAKKMGNKYVDSNLCIKCGICKKSCPYRAIELNPSPVFNENKCYGCWSCYNHCPTKAIFTKKLKGIGHYSSSNKQIQEKLK
jgi:ferredoxin/flavodoxin